MATYTYPTNDLEKARNLLALLGTHWNSYYAGNYLVEDYTFARAQEELQAYTDLLETVSSIARSEVPIYHTDNWYFLVLKESEANNGVLKYGSGAEYGGPYTYGGPRIVQQAIYTTFPLPEGLRDFKFIFNRLTEPSVTFTKGLDVSINEEESLLTFYYNPFNDPLIPKRDIIKGSEIVDREIGLWVFRGQFDWEHIYTHFGYILGLRLQSSEGYRALVNSILDAFVEGTAEKHMQLALSAITGVPVVLETQETIKLIQPDDEHLVIVTDVNVYKFPQNVTAVVSEGDTVYAGDQLVDTVTFYDLNTGIVPDDIFAVEMGIGFLPGGFVEGITFVNQDVSLVTETVGDKTKISFELGGLPTDIDLFWDLVHEKGIAAGETLANLLDIRESPTSEPTANNLPSTINPLEFLITNILRYNAFIVKIKLSGVLGNIALSNTRLFRKIIPPWTALIVLIELDVTEDPVIMEDAGTETNPGYLETVETFTGADPVEEGIDAPTYISETASLRLVSGICR